MCDDGEHAMAHNHGQKQARHLDGLFELEFHGQRHILGNGVEDAALGGGREAANSLPIPQTPFVDEEEEERAGQLHRQQIAKGYLKKKCPHLNRIYNRNPITPAEMI